MADIQKICNALEKAKDIIEQWIPMFEQYNTPSAIDDALELLKKQEPTNVIETSKDRIGVPEKSCPKCNIPIPPYVYGQRYLGEIRYCPWCGQAVKWE